MQHCNFHHETPLSNIWLWAYNFKKCFKVYLCFWKIHWIQIPIGDAAYHTSNILYMSVLIILSNQRYHCHQNLAWYNWIQFDFEKGFQCNNNRPWKMRTTLGLTPPPPTRRITASQPQNPIASLPYAPDLSRRYHDTPLPPPYPNFTHCELKQFQKVGKWQINKK